MKRFFSTLFNRFTFFLFFIFWCTHINAQHFLYSAPVANYNAVQTKIIGRVKNNIIVYNYTTSHTLDMRNSEILIYNDEMQLVNRTSLKNITPRISLIDVINEENFFAAVVQYDADGFSFCRLVSFDADGIILNNQVLERLPVINYDRYIIVKSTIARSFALLKVVPSQNAGSIAIKYFFVKNDSLTRSDKILLPFDTLSTALGKAFLDDNNLIIPVNNITDSGGRLALFKVDLSDNSSSNTIRSLNNSYLVPASIDIDGNYNQYIVTSVLRNDNINAGNKIFLWQLNKDLTDINADTVLTVDSISSCLQNINYFKLNTQLKKNTADVIISSEDNISNKGNYFSNPSYSAGSSAPVGSFYEGRVLSATGLKELNGLSLYAQSNVSRGPTWSNNSNANSGYNMPVVKSLPQTPTLAILNVNAKNNLNWSQCFNVSMEKDFHSLVNESVFINKKNILHIIYPRLTEKNKQSLSEIVLHSDGSYATAPIISMDIRYKYLLNQSLQLDTNSILLPCIIKGKLAFAKLTIE